MCQLYTTSGSSTYPVVHLLWWTATGSSPLYGRTLLQADFVFCYMPMAPPYIFPKEDGPQIQLILSKRNHYCIKGIADWYKKYLRGFRIAEVGTGCLRAASREGPEGCTASNNRAHMPISTRNWQPAVCECLLAVEHTHLRPPP